MIHDLLLTPTLAITAVAILTVLAVCVTRVLTTAIRAAQPADIPRIITTLCRHLASRRR